MKNINEQIEKISYLMGYNTQTTLTENKEVLTEQPVLSKVFGARPAGWGKTALKSLGTGVWDDIIKKVGSIKSVDGTVYKTGSELQRAMNTRGLKIAPAELGKIRMELLKSPSFRTFPDELQLSLAADYAKSPTAIKKYSAMPDEASIITQLKTRGFTDDAAQMVAKGIKNPEVAKQWSTKAKVAAGGAAVGTAAGLGYLAGKSGSEPKGTENKQAIEGYPECISSLSSKKEYNDPKTGKIYYYVDGGVDADTTKNGGGRIWFYPAPTHTVISQNGEFVGTYSCKESEAVVSEQEIPTDPNAITMPDDPNVDPYSEFNTSITFNWSKKPVTATKAPQKSKYTYKEDFPFTYMTKNPIISQIQKAIGMEQRYQTGNFGPITQKALQEKGYDLSQGITQDIYNNVISAATKARNTVNIGGTSPIVSKQTQAQPTNIPKPKLAPNRIKVPAEPAPETNKQARLGDRIDRLTKKRNEL